MLVSAGDALFSGAGFSLWGLIVATWQGLDKKNQNPQAEACALKS